MTSLNMMKYLILILSCIFFSAIAQESEELSDANLSDILLENKLWEMSQDEFTEEFEKGYKFRWTDKSKKSARSVSESLRYGDVTVGETLIYFKEGKGAALEAFVYNRGDQDEMSKTEFVQNLKGFTNMLNEKLGVEYKLRDKSKSAVRANAFVWVANENQYLLEYSGNPKSSKFKAEFIRFKVSPFEKVSITDRDKKAEPKTKKEIKQLVVSDGDKVIISNVPMVDQGPKGYCVAASTARVFRHYGLDVSMHDIAQIAGTTAGGGTRSDEMLMATKKIASRMGSQLRIIEDISDYGDYKRLVKEYNRKAKRKGMKECDIYRSHLSMMYNPEIMEEVKGEGRRLEKFQKKVIESIDNGLPMLWSLQLGKYPEEGRKASQIGGGHMRLIIGYTKDKENIIFSDSWGEGHERKTMKMSHASAATSSLSVIVPRK